MPGPDNRGATRHLAKPWWFPRFRRRPRATNVATVIYLIVGLDRDSMTPWHDNVRARDAAAAKEIARSRAGAAGVDLVVAAAIGPDVRVS